MEGRTARGHWRKRWKGEYTGRERDEDRELGSFSLLSLAEKRRGGEPDCMHGIFYGPPPFLPLFHSSRHSPPLKFLDCDGGRPPRAR